MQANGMLPGAAATDLSTALLRVLRGLRRLSAGDPVDGPALVVLHQVRAGSPVRLSDLATELGLDASTVSRHVRSLESAGHLARTGHPDDRRATLLTLTARGQDTLSAALGRRRALLDQALAGWSPADRCTLAELLARLADDLAPRRTPPDAAPAPPAPAPAPALTAPRPTAPETS